MVRQADEALGRRRSALGLVIAAFRRASLIGLLAVLLGACAGPTRSPEALPIPVSDPASRENAPADTGWTPLFNGRDLSGWAHVGRGEFVVDNGLLRTRGGMGLLWFTERKIGDSVLRIVYRNPGGDNSGVFIRIPEPPHGVWLPVHQGYEVQIDETDDEYHCTGVLYSMTRALARPGRPEEWNVMEIVLDGPRTVVTVNGELVTDYREGDPVKPKPWHQFWKFWAPRRGPRPDAGYIGLQNHSRRDEVFFREISVRPLGS